MRDFINVLTADETEQTIDLQFCLSSYLAFRYIVKKNIGWKKEWVPPLPDDAFCKQKSVRTTEEIRAALREILAAEMRGKRVGLLLSGGIDSAILAAFLPKGTLAYTIQFTASSAVPEFKSAREYADAYSLDHRLVRVSWNDYLQNMDFLMRRKRSPLHAVEVALYKASLQASRDGVDALIVGNGADSTFPEFVHRYTFIEPEQALREPRSVEEIYEPYRRESGFDVMQFLKVVHGQGIMQAFDNAIHAGGCDIIEPYERLSLSAPLDIPRIRRGESKYLLRSLFHSLYPDLLLQEKVPFARPMEEWLKNWKGPRRPEFLPDLSMERFSGDQKYLLLSLERFMNLID
jgi:hypothetical protein